MNQDARGFTLVELVVTVSVAGVLLAIVSPLIGGYLSARENAYRERTTLDNQRIAAALLEFSSTATAHATLPAPYTGAGYHGTIHDPTAAGAEAVALQQALLGTGIAPNTINDDGYTTRRVRVYQRVAGIPYQVPLYYRSGPLVTLAYDYGVIYQTSCPLADATCNPRPALGVPGESPVLTQATISTWAVAGDDYPATHVSTLPLQTALLAATTQRLDRIRDALTSYLRVHQVTAAAGDETNWFPTASSSLAGANPATNNGCRDGWYSLATTAVLPAVGLSPEEFGLTAWGGAVEYCRDYDPNASGTPDAPPHFAALRINSNVSQGIAPDNALPASNIVLTF